MDEIVLSAGVRQNLLALQDTAHLMSLTQNRLATGKKVNTAEDNPISFFTSQSLQSLAGDFNSLLDSLKFADTSAPSSSFDFYHRGRLLYLQKDYRGAAAALAAALELERKQRRLDLATWRSLVGDLADAYALTGDLARAKEVLDYAVESEPSNPFFHLALARYYGKVGDLDNAIAQLEKAAPFPKEVGLLQPRYDPERDPAFEKFRKDERFRKALKALRK